MQPAFSITNPAAELPESVASYLAADRANDLAALADCFTPDARVLDEDKEYLGSEAIIEWKKSAQSKYQYTVEPLVGSVDGSVVRVLARVSGNFPGSPIELTYRFELSHGKIALLEVE